MLALEQTNALEANPLYQWRDHLLMQALLSHGANPNTSDTNLHMSALEFEVVSGDCAAAEMLLDAGASPNTRFLFTPLQRAARNNRIEIAKLLIEHGSSMSSSENNRTVLHDACAYGDGIPMLQLLLSNHANINALDNNFRTPLDYAIAGTDIDNGGIQLDRVVNADWPDRIRFLLNHGADPCLKDKNGATALHYAQSLPNSNELQLIIRMLKRAERPKVRKE